MKLVVHIEFLVLPVCVIGFRRHENPEIQVDVLRIEIMEIEHQTMSEVRIELCDQHSNSPSHPLPVESGIITKKRVMYLKGVSSKMKSTEIRKDTKLVHIKSIAVYF